MSIALNMIIGPFEEPFIVAAISSVRNLVDEYVFVDTAPGNNPSRLMLDHLTLNYPNKVKIIDIPRGEDKDFSYADARELARINTESDWALRLDSDEVLHEDDIDTLLRVTEKENISSVEVEFYHFMIYPWLYQYTERKKILFRTQDFHWTRNVHELPIVNGANAYLPIHYYHYGYCRGQEEVYKRWVLYRDIEGKPAYYDNMNPAEILNSRLSVCMNFTGTHPLVVQPKLEEMFGDITPFAVKEIPRMNKENDYVGLMLITYNDRHMLDACLNTLVETIDYPTRLYIRDEGSTDGSFERLLEFQKNQVQTNPNIIDCVIEQADKVEYLCVALNIGFSYLLGLPDCSMIGWVHPDMKFEAKWLSELVAAFEKYPEAGKVCSWNTLHQGEPTSDEPLPGHQQAFIIKKEILLQVGLFDEAYIEIADWDDIDMNRRILLEGFRILIIPTSRVWHQGLATRGKTDHSAASRHNTQVYFKKWGDNKDGELFY